MGTPAIDALPISDEMGPVDYATVDPLNHPVLLACGTYVTTDLDRARRFQEEFYGLECVRHRPDAMLVRDKGRQWKGHRQGGEYWVWEVSEVTTIDHPQGHANHWGADVTTAEEVDRAHTIAQQRGAEWSFKKVNRCVTSRRGDYSFILCDADDNYWEVQYSPNRIEEFAAHDGFGHDAFDACRPAVGTYFMSHGTLQCGGDGNAARRFYAEFLGIGGLTTRPHFRSYGVSTMRHWYVACLPAGKRMRPQPPDNRWIFAVSTAAEVDRFHDLARAHQSYYRIQLIEAVQQTDDNARYCRICDLDGNWWEFQHRDTPPGRWYDTEFERGDVG